MMPELALSSEVDAAGIIMTIVFFNLGVSFLLVFIRLTKGPTLPDRVIALDLIGIISAAFIVAYAISVRQSAYLDVAITITLIAFLSTVAFARYIQRMSQIREIGHDSRND